MSESPSRRARPSFRALDDAQLRTIAGGVTLGATALGGPDTSGAAPAASDGAVIIWRSVPSGI